MKALKILGLLVLLAAAGSAGWFLGEKQRAGGTGIGSAHKQLYTCGMHPQIIRDAPGDCPICGMKLTPIRNQPDAAAQETNSSVITVNPATMQNMGIRTGLVTKGPLKRRIRTVGMIDYDETALADVTTKFRGWIEKLHVDATGQVVMKGDPLFSIYSPDLYSAQTEYLLALERATNSGGATGDALTASAKEKLKYFDVSDEQIAALEKSRRAAKSLEVHAPRDGIVVEKMAVEGQMVDAGMRLYRLADLAIVWVQSQVYEQDLPFVKLGQETVVSLSYLPDRKFRGRVTYVYPTVDDKTRTVRVRMEFHNPGYFLKPGMFATVELETELSNDAVLVPDEAVLRSGERNTVFVALDGGRFEPRRVVLGPRSADNMYQVLSGVSEGERVVTSGQFMLDSESQLRDAIQKMEKTGATETAAEVSTPGARTAEAAGGTNSVVYICPMPEHVAIQYDHPGKCPLCGMTLIPVSQETLAKLQPGGRVKYYTCPMPEHSDVHVDKPGKCPKCGMTLIPVMEAPELPKVIPLPESEAGGHQETGAHH